MGSHSPAHTLLSALEAAWEWSTSRARGLAVSGVAVTHRFEGLSRSCRRAEGPAQSRGSSGASRRMIRAWRATSCCLINGRGLAKILVRVEPERTSASLASTLFTALPMLKGITRSSGPHADWQVNDQTFIAIPIMVEAAEPSREHYRSPEDRQRRSMPEEASADPGGMQSRRTWRHCAPLRMIAWEDRRGQDVVRTAGHLPAYPAFRQPGVPTSSP